jgi:hypothetical protein
MEDRIFSALILNDYGGDKNYATKVMQQVKTIETRMRRTNFRGDLVICCGAGKSVTANRGKALCIVNLYGCEPMQPKHEPYACIECIPGRFSWYLCNWQWFDRLFEFRHYYLSGPYQGIFKIRIPDNVQILNQPLMTEGSNSK